MSERRSKGLILLSAALIWQEATIHQSNCGASSMYFLYSKIKFTETTYYIHTTICQCLSDEYWSLYGGIEIWGKYLIWNQMLTG